MPYPKVSCNVSFGWDETLVQVCCNLYPVNLVPGIFFILMCKWCSERHVEKLLMLYQTVNNPKVKAFGKH